MIKFPTRVWYPTQRTVDKLDKHRKPIIVDDGMIDQIACWASHELTDEEVKRRQKVLFSSLADRA